MKYYVYTLAHPITNEIRYIGKTNRLIQTLSRHFRDKKLTYKTSWIKSLKRQNFKPVIEVLEEFDNELESYQAETYWIRQFRAWGFRLVNSYISNDDSYPTAYRGEKNANSKITKEIAFKIKNLLYNTELFNSQIAKQLNVSVSIVRNIRNGDTWAYLDNYVCSQNSRKHVKFCKAVAQFSLEGVLISNYTSIQKAAKSTNTNASSIGLCLTGKRFKANGFIWKRTG